MNTTYFRTGCDLVGEYGERLATLAAARATLAHPELIAPHTYWIAEHRGSGKKTIRHAARAS